MLRDDERLRNLHRETLKRRKRFQAKQKKLEDEENNRRIYALERRRIERNRHLSGFRKNNQQNYYHKQLQEQHKQNVPIRAQRGKINKINKNYGEFSRFIVPVCDQLPSPNLSSPSPKITRNKQSKSTKKVKNKKISNVNYKTNDYKLSEKKTDYEFNENQNEKEEYHQFENAMSDQLSIAELDDFEKKHFGIQESIQYDHNNNNKENISNNSSNINYSKLNASNCSILKKSAGYQQIFKQKVDYIRNKNHNNKNEIISSPLQSINGSLFAINDVDMKSPEDNDSVKINPKDSIDCDKMNFSTIYNSNLLPLQSVLENKRNIALKSNNKSRINYLRPPSKVNNNFPLRQSQISNANTVKSNKSYGIKLPRLTQSILKEKDRLDSQNDDQGSRPKSIVSAPVWNRYLPKGIGYNMAINRKRNTTTIIDDFFTKTSDEFVVDSHRKSNNTMFLPNINRSKLKPKRQRYSKFNNKENNAYSVISQYDILREESKLEKSLMRINETLSNLEVDDRNYKKNYNQNYKNYKQRKYPNYMNDTKVSSIPRKIKTKKSPTFKSSRQRRRWKS